MDLFYQVFKPILKKKTKTKNSLPHQIKTQHNSKQLVNQSWCSDLFFVGAEIGLTF